MWEYTDEMIGLLARAGSAGSGWKILARTIGPHVGSTLVEIGGGLGFLANELKGDVSVIEKDEKAFSYLSSHASSHVHPVKGDAHVLTPRERKGDVICCRFGSLLEDLVLARKWGDGKLVMVVRHAMRTRLLLSSLSIPFREESLLVEMGQPFANQEEVRLYERLYGKRIAAFLKKSDGEFPFWLEKNCLFSLFVIAIPDIPDLVQRSTMLVEGAQGIGKSTLVRSIATAADGGFETKRVDGRVYLNLLGESTYDLAHQVGICHKGGDPARFDALGSEILDRPCSLRVMDELGFLERDALIFQDRVLRAVKDSVPTIAVIKPAQVPFLDKIRESENAFRICLSPENRDAWKEELERAIRNIPEWPLLHSLLA